MKKLLLLILVLLVFSVESANTNANVKRLMGNWTVSEIFPKLINNQWGAALADSVLVMRYNDTVYTLPFSGTDTLPIIKFADAFVECNSDGTITISPNDANKTTVVSGVEVIDVGLLRIVSSENEGEIVFANTNNLDESYLNLKGKTGGFDLWRTITSNNTIIDLYKGAYITYLKKEDSLGIERGRFGISDFSTGMQSGTSLITAEHDGGIILTPTVESGVNPVSIDGVPMIKPSTPDNTMFIAPSGNPSSGTVASLQQSTINLAVDKDGDNSNINIVPTSFAYEVEEQIMISASSTGSAYLKSPNGRNTIDVNNTLCSNTNDTATYNADVTNTATVNKNILESRLITAPLRKIVKGYTEPYTIISTFDNPTRTISITSTTDTVEFYSGGNLFRYPNGDPALSYQVPNLNQWVWTYQDSTGAFQSETSVSINSIRNYNLGPFMRYDVALGQSIATVNRIEASQANEIENEASYETKSLIANEAVLFTGSVGSNSIGHSGGVYYTSRDKRFEFIAVDSSAKTWVKYYQDSLDDAGKNWVMASQTGSGVPYFTDVELGIGATGRLVYDSLVNGYFKIAIVPVNDYVACHFFVADGATQNVLSIMGQEVYNSVQDARDGIGGERTGLIIDSDVFRDAAIVGSCIFKANGTLQYIDPTLLTLFDYPVGGIATGISAGPGSQNLSQVLQTGNDGGDLDIVNVSGISVGTSILQTTSVFTPVEMEGGTVAGRSDIASLDMWSNTYFDGAYKHIMDGRSIRNVIDPVSGFLVQNSASGTADNSFSWATIYQLDHNGIATLPASTTTNITAAGAKAVATTEWVDTAIVNSLQLSLTFGREGFAGGYGGGTAWIPYTRWTEDNATLQAGSGVIVALNSKITSATFQFDAMADNATAYYRINGGTPVSLGTVTSATLHNTFYPLSINVSAGDEVEFGFNGASGSTYTGCTVTTSVRQQ